MLRSKSFHLWSTINGSVSSGLILFGTAFPNVCPTHGRAQTPSFSDDAEQGIYETFINNGWSPDRAGISLEHTVVHSGLYSWRAAPGSDGFHGVPMGFSPIYLVCYFYIPSTTTISSGGNSGTVCGLLSTTSWLTSGVGVTNKSGILYLTATGLPTGTHAVSTGVWHRIEYQYGPTATVWLDGMQDSTGTIATETKNNALIGMLNASGTTGNIYIDDIQVSGTKSNDPIAGLTIRHAYPGNRSGMRVQSYIWGAASTDSLVVSIDGTSVSTAGNPGTYQQPAIDLTGLSAGSHTLLVALKDSNGSTRVSSSETIVAHGGTPLVAIDQDNNLVRGGHKIFPVSGWWTQGYALNWMQNGYGNTSGWVSGWAASYTTAQYQAFMENDLNCLSNGIGVMGPAASRMGGFGTDAQNFAGYGAYFTNHPCQLIWTSYDEASVNGIPIATMQAGLNAIHRSDNNHPYTYDDATLPLLHLEWYYPTLVADIYSSDNYPLCYAESFHGQGKQFSDWVDEMDREAHANYGIVPNFQILELYKEVIGNYDCTSNNPVTRTAVSNTTIYNEAWMAVIHGRKGVIWYDNGSLTSAYGPVCTSDSAGNCFPANPENHIGKFTKDIATITPDVVLAAPTGRTVASDMTTNCNSSGSVLGRRVDATVREDSKNIWIFAARLTDPICSPAENGASPLSTSLTISGLGDGTATVFNESRTVSITGGVLTDTFAPWAVHIYQIAKAPVPAPPVLNAPKVQ